MSDLYEWTWPIENARGAVVIVHGLGEHSGRYGHVAHALNDAGFAVYAQDVRGHGRSEGFPGRMGEDTDALIGDVVEHCRRVGSVHDKLFLLAHSMGTLLALPAVPRLPSGTLQGLILSGTALDPGPAAADLVANGAVPAETLSRDPGVVEAYVGDPLVWDSVPPEVMVQAVDVGQTARDAVPIIDVPVLLIHGTEDRLCDISGSEYIHSQLVVTDKTLLIYPGLRHEVLNEPERNQVIRDVVSWLDARCA